jgi:hypothetical protein
MNSTSPSFSGTPGLAVALRNDLSDEALDLHLVYRLAARARGDAKSIARRRAWGVGISAWQSTPRAAKTPRIVHSRGPGPTERSAMEPGFG